MARAARNLKGVVVDVHPLLLSFRSFLISNVRATTEDRDLSQRQMAIFLKVATEPDAEHTVRGLAELLNVAKPAICRAVDRLEQLEIVVRHPDLTDRRSVFIRRTTEGARYLRTLTRIAEQSGIAEAQQEAA